MLFNKTHPHWTSLRIFTEGQREKRLWQCHWQSHHLKIVPTESEHVADLLPKIVSVFSNCSVCLFQSCLVVVAGLIGNSYLVQSFKRNQACKVSKLIRKSMSLLHHQRIAPMPCVLQGGGKHWVPHFTANDGYCASLCSLRLLRLPQQ